MRATENIGIPSVPVWNGSRSRSRAGVSQVTLYLGRTPSSGIADIFVDGIPITNGNAHGGAGMDLYTPDPATSDDLDLIVVSADGSSQVNLTNDDLADQMLLIGDEVSWVCGLCVRGSNGGCSVAVGSR